MPHRLFVRLAACAGLFLLAVPAALTPARAEDAPTTDLAADTVSAASPAPAEAGAAPRAGRYTMVPADGGFVRLDTETGIVSQCRRETRDPDAAWRCATIPESTLSAPDRTGELASQVEQLSRKVAALEARLDASERAAAAEAERAKSAAAATSDEAEFNRSLDFSEELMRRFFGMVRDMKRDERANPG